MTLELIVFIAAILFGIVLYWRESKGNNLYRFFNKIINTKALQIGPHDKIGFVYQQTFLLRLVFIGLLFLLCIVITQFLIPINMASVSIFASLVVGTLLGTYFANFIIKSTEVIEAQTNEIEDIVGDTFEKGRGFIEDLKSVNPKPTKGVNKEVNSTSKKEQKSARERLKDKGLL